jgi:hypothetical protein
MVLCDSFSVAVMADLLLLCEVVFYGPTQHAALRAGRPRSAEVKRVPDAAMPGGEVLPLLGADVGEALPLRARVSARCCRFWARVLAMCVRMLMTAP